MVQLEHEKTTGQQLALAAAKTGIEFITGIRHNRLEAVRPLMMPGSTAELQLELFGTPFFRLVLKLDDPREQGKLEPYAFQVEELAGLLELGVLEALPEGEGHSQRLFGSCVLLVPDGQVRWLIAEVLPVNSDSNLNIANPLDREILAVLQGRKFFPPQTANIDKVEALFLTNMQSLEDETRPVYFNMEELLNAYRFWQDYKKKKLVKDKITGKPGIWAAGVEYLITLFDHFQADANTIAHRYKVSGPAVISRAREMAQLLNTTQFDERYTIHPDPIAHFREVFKELGGKFSQEEMDKADRELNKVFNSVEVPPDDTDFYGPNR